jgi:hypothetical protein
METSEEVDLTVTMWLYDRRLRIHCCNPKIPNERQERRFELNEEQEILQCQMARDEAAHLDDVRRGLQPNFFPTRFP